MPDPARKDPFLEPGATFVNGNGAVVFEVDTIVVDDRGTAWLGNYSDLWEDRGPWVSVPMFFEFLEDHPDVHRAHPRPRET